MVFERECDLYEGAPFVGVVAVHLAKARARFLLRELVFRVVAGAKESESCCGIADEIQCLLLLLLPMGCCLADRGFRVVDHCLEFLAGVRRLG